MRVRRQTSELGPGQRSRADGAGSDAPAAGSSAGRRDQGRRWCRGRASTLRRRSAGSRLSHRVYRDRTVQRRRSFGLSRGRGRAPAGGGSRDLARGTDRLAAILPCARRGPARRAGRGRDVGMGPAQGQEQRRVRSASGHHPRSWKGLRAGPGDHPRVRRVAARLYAELAAEAPCAGPADRRRVRGHDRAAPAAREASEPDRHHRGIALDRVERHAGDLAQSVWRRLASGARFIAVAVPSGRRRGRAFDRGHGLRARTTW